MFIADSHNDFLTKFNRYGYERYVDEQVRSGLKIMSCAVFTTELNNPISFIKEANDFLVDYNTKNKQSKLLLSIEDMYFVDLLNISEIIKLKPISCGLTWNYENSLAGGVFSEKGVTSKGKNIIKKLEEKNILIDTAHLNKKSFFDVCEVTSKPIYNSHCCLNSLNKNDRNLDDEQIDILVKSNGYLGVCFVGKFLTKNKVRVNDVVKHILYFIEKYGYKNIGIGSDFNGTEDLPQCLKCYADFKWLENEFRKMGVDDNIIECVFYKNYVEFLMRNSLINF